MSANTGRPVNPTEQAIDMFERLSNDLRDLDTHWQQVPIEYADQEEYCRGRADGCRESALAVHQVVENARRDTATAVAGSEAGAASLRSALEKIIDHHPEYVSASPELVAEIEACPECKRAQERRWPPSGLCNDHYCKRDEQVTAKNNHVEKYQYLELKHIAREAVNANSAGKSILEEIQSLREQVERLTPSEAERIALETAFNLMVSESFEEAPALDGFLKRINHHHKEEVTRE